MEARPSSPLDILLARLRRRRRPNAVIDAAYAHFRAFCGHAAIPAEGPLFSVLMPVFDTPAGLLAEAIASVRAQTYTRWQLCIADDASAQPHVQRQLRAEAAADPRISLIRLPKNSGIATATNAALVMAEGEFTALLDHDDALAPNALARVAAEIVACPEAELIFSDEDQLIQGRRRRPYFKPGWNPELMGAQNVVNHLAVYRTARLRLLGGLHQGFEGAQDYELVLRFAAACGPLRIRHIPEILYHWRQLPTSFSAARSAHASAAARRAVSSHLPTGTTVQPDAKLPQWNRVAYALPCMPPLVSIVTASDTGPFDLLYTNVEILRGGPATATGEVLLLLSPALRPSSDGWIRELVSQALRPEIAAAGARLDRPDGRIANAGLILDSRHIAQTLTPASDADDPGYFGHFFLARTVSALSTDCLAIRRSLFEHAGGLDPACGCYAGIDLCLRLAREGLRCVWTPHARLRYITTTRRARDPAAARLMRARWGETLARDPYLNPNLAVRHGTLALARRPHLPSRSAPQ